MAKQGMKRPEITHTHPRNEVPPVPTVGKKAQHAKQCACPMSEKAPDVSQSASHDHS